MLNFQTKKQLKNKIKELEKSLEFETAKNFKLEYPNGTIIYTRNAQGERIAVDWLYSRDYTIKTYSLLNQPVKSIHKVDIENNIVEMIMSYGDIIKYYFIDEDSKCLIPLDNFKKLKNDELNKQLDDCITVLDKIILNLDKYHNI